MKEARDAGGQSQSRGPVCRPTGAGPYYLLERESVQIQVRCDTGEPAEGLAFESLPDGADYDTETRTLRWTPALDQAATYELVLQAKATGESAVVKIAVADRWDDPNNAPIVDEHTYTEEFGLPVLHLHPDPTLNDAEYTPASVVYMGHEFTGAKAQYRGSFSAKFPKRSYTLKFTKADKFSDTEQAGGFVNKRKITLISPFNDNSYLRTRLGFDTWNALDPEHIQVQTYSAVVFLNGQYHGIYTICDHVDEYLMEDFGLAQEGNLYKARSHDANFRLIGDEGQPKASLHDGYSKESGTPEDGQPSAYDDLDELVDWVANSSSERFVAELDLRMRREDYEDWWIFVSFLRADDTVGKNSYHYHDPLLPGSRFRFVPWDLDESFGQDYRTTRVDAVSGEPETGAYIARNHLTERMLAEPELSGPLRERYAAALRAALAPETLIARIDQLASEIEPSAARDEAKWAEDYRYTSDWSSSRMDFLTHAEEVEYLRQWARDRNEFLRGIYP